MKIKKMDFDILKFLYKDSSIPYAEIARSLDLSRAVVTNRVNSMIARKVIKRFTVAVDFKKLGKDLHVLFEIEILPQQTNEILNELAEGEEIENIITTSQSVLFVFAMFDNSSDLNLYIKERLSIIPGINKIKTNILLESYPGRVLNNNIEEE